MTHGYRNVLGEERIEVSLFETGNATLDAILTDWFFGVQQGGPFVDLAASLAGAQVVTAAVAVMRNLGAALAGLGNLTAALAMLRSLAAAASGSEVITGGLDRLIGLAAGGAGESAAAAAIAILRGLAAEILGAGAAATEMGVARALAAAADAAMQITADLTVEGGGQAPPVQPAKQVHAVLFFGKRRAHYWWQDDEDEEERRRRELIEMAAAFKEMAERSIEVDDMEILELA